jgi:hypothetical protein
MGLIQHIIRHLRGPECPADAECKELIEDTFLWLEQEFGKDPLLRPPLVPTSELFPNAWTSSYEDGLRLATDLCQFMYVDTALVEFVFFSAGEDPMASSLPEYSISREGPAGLYVHPESKSKFLIALDEGGLQRPTALVATICHELSHIRLLGESRLSREDKDHERKTDLLTIYFGAGVYTANSAFEFSQWTDMASHRQGWRASRLGYLSESELGYSLAAYALIRGESKPSWRKHLSPNIRYYFDESSFFLERGGLTKLVDTSAL